MRLMPILLCATLPLAACTPRPESTAPAAASPPGGTPATTASTADDTPAPSATATEATPTPVAGSPGADTAPVAPTGSPAVLSGSIRDGNRAPPALQVCAHPVDGGTPTCKDSAAGAATYRLEVAPGRYRVIGWVQDGELALIAHATQIRCIRAPCPPDTLIEVEVAAGEDKGGLDLTAGYAVVPAGWPTKP